MPRSALSRIQFVARLSKPCGLVLQHVGWYASQNSKGGACRFTGMKNASLQLPSTEYGRSLRVTAATAWKAVPLK